MYCINNISRKKVLPPEVLNECFYSAIPFKQMKKVVCCSRFRVALLCLKIKTNVLKRKVVCFPSCNKKLQGQNAVTTRRLLMLENLVHIVKGAYHYCYFSRFGSFHIAFILSVAALFVNNTSPLKDPGKSRKNPFRCTSILGLFFFGAHFLVRKLFFTGKCTL